MATKDQRQETRDEREKEIPNSKHEIRNPKQIRIAKIQIFETKKEGENGGLNKAAGYQLPAASGQQNV